MPCGRLGFVLYETDSSSVDIVILLDSTTRPSNMVDQKHVLLWLNKSSLMTVGYHIAVKN